MSYGYENLLVEIDARVATVTINKPEKRNALSSGVRADLTAAVTRLIDDDDVRVIVITGAGDKAFVAGADIAEFAKRTPLEQRTTMESPVFDVIANSPKPTIASINGFALGGGCELAMACDTRIAARSARLGQPEVKLGILPGGGGTQRLPRLVGTGRALRWMLTGEMIDAETAYAAGLVDEVVDDAALRARTRELAQAIAAHSPVALKLIKDSVRNALDAPMSAGLRAERELFITAFSSDDRTEGVAAFLEKRAPDFKGR